MHRLPRRTCPDGRREQPRPPAGSVSAEARVVSFGELAQGCVQPNVETGTTELGSTLLERRAVVSVVLRCQLWRRAYQHSERVHPATKHTALTGLYPRPEGRGFTPERVSNPFRLASVHPVFPRQSSFTILPKHKTLWPKRPFSFTSRTSCAFNRISAMGTA